MLLSLAITAYGHTQCRDEERRTGIISTYRSVDLTLPLLHSGVLPWAKASSKIKEMQLLLGWDVHTRRWVPCRITTFHVQQQATNRGHLTANRPDTAREISPAQHLTCTLRNPWYSPATRLGMRAESCRAAECYARRRGLRVFGAAFKNAFSCSCKTLYFLFSFFVTKRKKQSPEDHKGAAL